MEMELAFPENPDCLKKTWLLLVRNKEELTIMNIKQID